MINTIQSCLPTYRQTTTGRDTASYTTNRRIKINLALASPSKQYSGNASYGSFVCQQAQKDSE